MDPKIGVELRALGVLSIAVAVALSLLAVLVVMLDVAIGIGVAATAGIRFVARLWLHALTGGRRRRPSRAAASAEDGSWLEDFWLADDENLIAPSPGGPGLALAPGARPEAA